MSSYGSSSFSKNDSRNNKDDDPPMSRLFIICNKATTENDVRDAFEKFGEIEEIWMVKDKGSGESKGIAYVKYTKTSAAAKALEEMNGKTMGNVNRAIKVLVASSRNQGSSRSENEQEKYVRLFVLTPKEMTDDEIDDEFRQYGDLENVSIIRDKVTKERKGIAYIKYAKFSDAATAFENCHPKFKAVFAEPRSNSKDNKRGVSHSFDDDYYHHNNSAPSRRSSDFSFAPKDNSFSGETQLSIICSSLLNQDQLWRLFDIIPGLDYCQITGEYGRSSNYATAVYTNAEACAYAREKLHGLEYPLGERLIIKPIADMKSNADNLFFPPSDGGVGGGSSKEPFCSVRLPDATPLAGHNATCAQRCFVVCVPKALPQKTLMNVFSRFGNLIDVYLLPNKTCGYAKYSSANSAIKAIEILNGAEVNGVKLKVLEAEAPRHSKRKRYEEE